ncbi:unnamed protein product [Orchesella dallaii]|uniref:Galectin n=1 Tax=Orchesella dallaii TaxID=48710 RepID=A0ABP1PIV3_9HEXA
MKNILVLLTFHACQGLLLYNPQIPFVTMLDNGLSVGDKITITGRTLPEAYSFAINLHHKWTHDREMILFHFNPRFYESNVVYDTYIDEGGWISFGSKSFGISFTKGNNFTVEILCQEDQFNVTVDGDPFLEYKYKLPLKIADMLEIKGERDRDVEIFSLDWELFNSSGFATMKILLVLLTFHACHSMQINNPKIPFVTKLANKLTVGTKITVTGRTLPHVYRFAINIRQGWKEVGGINLFHFNPRLDGPNVITGTHIEGVGWINFGHHEFPYGSHFQKGNNFTVEIECQKEQFSVKLDGDHFLVYKYMLPVEVADVLEIKTVRNQDIEIFSVSVSSSSMVDIMDFSGTVRKDLNFDDTDTPGNNVLCDSSSPFLIAFLILFVLLSIIFFVIILWLTGWLDVCRPK